MGNLDTKLKRGGHKFHILHKNWRKSVKSLRSSGGLRDLDENKSAVKYVSHDPDTEIAMKSLQNPINKKKIRAQIVEVRKMYHFKPTIKVPDSRTSKIMSHPNSPIGANKEKRRKGNPLFVPGHAINVGKKSYKTKQMFYRIQLEKAMSRVERDLKVNIFDHFVCRALESDVVLVAIMKKLIPDQKESDGKVTHDHKFRPIHFIPHRLIDGDASSPESGQSTTADIGGDSPDSESVFDGQSHIRREVREASFTEVKAKPASNTQSTHSILLPAKIGGGNGGAKV